LEALPELLALFLARICLDRSVLLGELPDSLWLLLLDRGLMKFADLQPVKAARDLAKSETRPEESLRPDRYLASECRFENSDSYYSFSSRVNACRSHSWTWLEHLAARGPMSGWAVAEVLEEVFLESTTLSSRKLAYANNFRRLPFTFAERCAVSGCSELQGPVSLDTSVDVSRAPSWQHAPRARLAVLAKSLRSVPRSDLPLEAWRFRGHLLAEQVLRSELASIQGSWKSSRAGLRCWACFMDDFFSRSAHFPPTWECLSGYGSIFANGDSLGHYVRHVRLGARLCRVSNLFPAQDLVSGLLRGSRKLTVRKPRIGLDGKQTSLVVKNLLGNGLVELARFVVLARAFLCRVADELAPLQLDGRSGLAPGDTRWHSQIIFAANSVTVRLKSRKNAPEGAELVRSCECKGSPRLLCGFCSLQAQVKSQDWRPGQRLWHFSAAQGLVQVKLACAELAIPISGWQAFRRGAARDMMNSGCTLAQILGAGGWRSGAFLRYLTRRDIDQRSALELALVESDSD
jgi:hypothetical protein